MANGQITAAKTTHKPSIIKAIPEPKAENKEIIDKPMLYKPTNKPLEGKPSINDKKIFCYRDYKSAEEMNDKIDEYFEKGGKVRKIIVGQGNNKQVVNTEIFTITGLIMYLGYVDRSEFFKLERDPRLSPAVKRARSLMENIYEENLQITGGAGNIFALKNFGWIDKQEIVTEDKTLRLDI